MSVIHRQKWVRKIKKNDKCFGTTNYKFYCDLFAGDSVIKIGDFVMLKTENPNEPLAIAKVVQMYVKFPQMFMFHGHLFCRGIDTILGETADPREIFLVDNCEDLPLGTIVCKAEVNIIGIFVLNKFISKMFICFIGPPFIHIIQCV